MVFSLKSPPILWIPEKGLLMVEAAARIPRLLPLAHLQHSRDLNNFSSQRLFHFGTDSDADPWNRTSDEWIRMQIRIRTKIFSDFKHAKNSIKFLIYNVLINEIFSKSFKIKNYV